MNLKYIDPRFSLRPLTENIKAQIKYNNKKIDGTDVEFLPYYLTMNNTYTVLCTINDKQTLLVRLNKDYKIIQYNQFNTIENIEELRLPHISKNNIDRGLGFTSANVYKYLECNVDKCIPVVALEVGNTIFEFFSSYYNGGSVEDASEVKQKYNLDKMYIMNFTPARGVDSVCYKEFSDVQVDKVTYNVRGANELKLSARDILLIDDSRKVFWK